MARYRNALPQLSEDLFLTDGGLETTLLFHDGIDLPGFSTLAVLDSQAGRDRLEAYYQHFAELASKRGLGLVLETATWRASEHWGTTLGYDPARVRALNLVAVDLVRRVRDQFDASPGRIVISGCIGPAGDGYAPESLLDPDAAASIHAPQIRTFADSHADMVSALTLTHTGEAIGIVRVASDADIPVAIYFTVETDGRLPSGENLGEAIEAVDAATGSAAVHFGINCAHPTHFAGVLLGAADEPWIRRLRAVRGNASTRSHAELDEATELDTGDPAEFGRQTAALRARLPHLSVLGGCCGTDDRHIEAIAEAGDVALRG